MKAEYVSLAYACETVEWLNQTLKELGTHRETLVKWNDNYGAMDCAEYRNAKRYDRRKQIDIKRNYIKKLIKGATVSLSAISRDKVKADILTEAMGLREVQTPSQNSELFSQSNERKQLYAWLFPAKKWEVWFWINSFDVAMVAVKSRSDGEASYAGYIEDMCGRRPM